jgi:hypothetical protein
MVAIEAARLRASTVANVVKLQVVPKAIETLPAQHDAAELKPDPSRSPADNRRDLRGASDNRPSAYCAAILLASVLRLSN